MHDVDGADPAATVAGDFEAVMLDQLKLHPLAVEDISQERMAPKIEEYDDYLDQTHRNRSMSALLQQRPRLGGEARSESGPADFGPAPTADLVAALERIRQLPFGTWLEFVQKPPAAPLRRRLSWFSEVTGRAVLLSARGGKGDEYSLAQLAGDLARGQLRVMPDQQAQLLDQAWRAVMALQRASLDRASAGSRA